MREIFGDLLSDDDIFATDPITINKETKTSNTNAKITKAQDLPIIENVEILVTIKNDHQYSKTKKKQKINYKDT